MRSILKKLTLLGFCVSLSLFAERASAQTMEISNLSASKLLNMAQNAERISDVYSASRFYQAYVNAKPKKSKIRWKLSEIQEQIRDYEGANSNYEYLLQQDADGYPKLRYKLAGIQMKMGNYSEAKNLYEAFLKDYKEESDYSDYRKLVKSTMAGCDTSLMLQDQPLNVVIDKLGSGINNPHADQSPIIMGDELVFSSLRQNELTYFHIDSVKPKRRFFKTNLKDKAQEWVLNGVPEDVDLSSGSFNEEGDRFYYSQCEADWKNEKRCDLYRIDIDNGVWGEPLALDEVNSKGYSSTMPTVTRELVKNREVLYFISDRPEGSGGRDIWYTVYDEKKKRYKEPKNLSRKINSPLDELAPYYDMVERKLYFSSEGGSGLGGFDIYSARGELRKFAKKANVGYPINTGFDEVAYVLSPDRKGGYLVSNRSAEGQLTHPYCCDDIFRFQYPDKVILGMTGFVLDVDNELYFKGESKQLGGMSSMNSIPLENAEAILYLKEEGEEVQIDRKLTDDIGYYFFDLEPDKEYRVEIAREGYLNNFIEVNTLNKTVSDTLYHNFGMASAASVNIVVDNIEFASNSVELSPKSIETLNSSLLVTLRENPDFGLEVSAHTDDVGPEAYNQKLSERRANAVVEYLIAQGISEERLKSIGYGEAKPLEPNSFPDGRDNPEGRERNRRVEVQLIPPSE